MLQGRQPGLSALRRLLLGTCTINNTRTAHRASPSQRDVATASSSAAMYARRTVRGVVFDMDGTLTVPCIDFALMRQRVGVPKGDILDVINSWPEDKQKTAYAIIAEMEDKALEDMQLMPGTVELCRFLDQNGLPRGLITRNVRHSIDHFHGHHLPVGPFLPAVSRDCGFNYKPDPQALLHICSTWGIDPSECIMVGDSVKHDVVSGRRAGAITILLDYEGRDGYKEELFKGEQRPDYVVKGLFEIIHILERDMDLLPPTKEQQAAEAVQQEA